MPLWHLSRFPNVCQYGFFTSVWHLHSTWLPCLSFGLCMAAWQDSRSFLPERCPYCRKANRCVHVVAEQWFVPSSARQRVINVQTSRGEAAKSRPAGGIYFGNYQFQYKKLWVGKGSPRILRWQIHRPSDITVQQAFGLTVYRPAEGAAPCKSRRLRLSGKQKPAGCDTIKNLSFPVG